MEDEEGDEEVPELCFRERAEKSTGGEVVLLEWSPTMDILALALSDHSIVVNRLSWQKVWSVPPLKALPTAMTWRPDGKVLAVGSQSGSVSLYNVEKGQLMNKFVADAAVTCLSWAMLEEEGATLEEEGESVMEEDDHTSLTEGWSDLLPPLPAVDRRIEDVFPGDSKLLRPTEALRALHLLLVGLENGSIHILALGIFLIATVNSGETTRAGAVVSCKMSPSLSDLCALRLANTREDHGDQDQSNKDQDRQDQNDNKKDENGDQVVEPGRGQGDRKQKPALLHLEVLETSELSSKARELHSLVQEFGQVVCHLEYLNSVLTAMLEAWDDLLFTLDNQLASYAKTLSEGRTVADEFLVLLACGSASQDLKDFLVTKLTAKGVKKLGLSMEHSYSNIKKFLLHHFQLGVQGLLVHLGGLLYMTSSDPGHRFGSLGLSGAAVQSCVNTTGTMGLKSQEMILAIDHSLRSAKVFFMWLYVTILKLSEEPVPKTLKDDLTPEELKLVMDFLKKRLTKARSGNHAFNMEIVGQYLSNSDLKYVEEKPAGYWEEFVSSYHSSFSPSSSPSVPCLFQPSRSKSLFQLYRQLKEEVDRTFTEIAGPIEASLVSSMCEDVKPGFQDISCDRLDTLLCPFSYEELSAFCMPSSEVEVSEKRGQSSCLEMDLILFSSKSRKSKKSNKMEKVTFYICNVEKAPEKEENKRCPIVSVRPYNDNTLTILAQYSFKVPEEDPKTKAMKMVTVTHSILAQLPLSHVVSRVGEEGQVDAGPLLEQVHVLEPFKAGRLAVMGDTRKLAAVVAHNGKKVRLFDVEEEVDDDQNTSVNRSMVM